MESNFLEGRALGPAESTDQWRIDTVFGEFTGLKSDPAWELHAGEPVVLSVRPECWKLREAARVDGQAAANVVRGRIGRSVYLGELAEYDFQPRPVDGSSQAPLLKIFELNPRFLEVADDTEISARAAPEDVIVLHP